MCGLALRMLLLKWESAWLTERNFKSFLRKPFLGRSARQALFPLVKQTAFGRNVSREKQRVDKINAAFDKTCSQRQRSRHARRKMEHHTPQNKAMMLAGHKSAPFFLESCFLNTGNYGIQRGGSGCQRETT